MAWLLYGQRANGELIHIGEAVRGDECGCFCPHCQTPLAAKKGKVKVHHFAHVGKTCAYVSAYDFLHVENFVDTTLSLKEWANWKLEDMARTETRLQAEYAQHTEEMATVMCVMNGARNQLAAVSQPHPNRKQRNKVRQANYEVLLQWDAFLADHNTPQPDLARVRDCESCAYDAFEYRSAGRQGGRYVTTSGAWPNELWREGNKDKSWMPWWLTEGGLALLNDFGPLRRKLTTTRLHLDAFLAEKARFERFRLYFLLAEFTNRPPLFKIGITSRPNLTERLAEIKADLHPYGIASITCLAQLTGHAFLESYFKQKYAPQQVRLSKLSEYFAFDGAQLALILSGLNDLFAAGPDQVPEQSRGQRIQAGMTQAREQGVHVGRPRGSEADARFLCKPKSKLVVELMGKHPEWSLRETARHSGIALNTVCKVAKLMKDWEDRITISPVYTLRNESEWGKSVVETAEKRCR